MGLAVQSPSPHSLVGFRKSQTEHARSTTRSVPFGTPALPGETANRVMAVNSKTTAARVLESTTDSETIRRNGMWRYHREGWQFGTMRERHDAHALEFTMDSADQERRCTRHGASIFTGSPMYWNLRKDRVVRKGRRSFAPIARNSETVDIFGPQAAHALRFTISNETI